MKRRECLFGLAACPVSSAFPQVPAAPQAAARTAAGDLALSDVIVGEYVTSLRLPDKFAFVSGMTVYLAFRVEGLKRESELNLVSFDYKVEAVDALGHPFEKPVTGRITRRVAQTEVVAAPLVRASVRVPGYVYPADAKFRIEVTDRLAKIATTSSATIPIRSEHPKPSGPFEILDLKVYRGEFDESAVADPVFRPGEPVWTRFLLAGFQWKADEYDLKYGLLLQSSDGRDVLSVPEAATERNVSPYQRAYVPGIAALRLERNVRPGNYVIVVVAADGVAGATAKASIPFRVTGA
jgi:hypothetical protein